MSPIPANPAQQTTDPSLTGHHCGRGDLHATLQAIAQGRTTVQKEMELSIALAQSPACKNTFLRLDGSLALHSATGFAPVVPAGAASQAPMPLGGLAISIKDLFDVAGQTTAAGSVVLANAVLAKTDCPAVARLKAAGGIVLGRTNMVEFAFSGIGTNPHYGTPVNPCDAATARIPGGSSSGAAVSVASGAAFVGLGSDTGGSIRIPAALCGLVGFKPTARLVPTTGALPLSHTLDTVCALTRSVRDARLVHEVLSASTTKPSAATLQSYRMAIVRTTLLDNLDATVAAAFARSIARLRQAGAQITEISLSEIAEFIPMQARGSVSAAEALAWHTQHGLWPAQRDAYDPRVALRIAGAEKMSAVDYVTLTQDRQNWMQRINTALAGFDAVLSPTVPLVAPPIASVAPGAAQDSEFFRINALMLRNTSMVNMLDGCAISLPCHMPGELPVGLMVWHGALHDDTVLNIAQQIEAILIA